MAEFDEADTEGANITEIIYEEVKNKISPNAKKLQKKSNFPGENFSHANASGKNFSESNLSGADFSNANLKNSSMSEVNFSYADLN